MTTCPACGKTVTTVQGRGSRGPQPNDLVVCLGCGAICVFDAALRLEQLRPERAHALDQRIVLEAIAVSDLVLRRRSGMN